MQTDSRMDIESTIGWSTSDKVVVRGHDLCRDLLGHVSLGDMAFLQFFDRLPTTQESVMFNALMVCLVEHGITPSALAARMTIIGAPEALQGAVAAGLIGLGSVFVGSMEGAAKALRAVLPEAKAPLDDGAIEELAARLVAEARAQGLRVAGLGHALHTPLDPRAERLFEIAAEQGFMGNYCRIMRAVSGLVEAKARRPMPVNATGAIGAICCEMGLRADAVRGIGVSARAIGLVGHILEETDKPMARKIKSAVDKAASRREL